MDEQAYAQWQAAHICATGANGSQVRETLDANRSTFDGMNATYEELCESTQRILDSGEIPNWPVDHITALIRNLKSLRAEREKRKRQGIYGGGSYTLHPPGCQCADCTTRPSRAKLDELKAYIRRHGGQVAGEGPKAKRKVKK